MPEEKKTYYTESSRRAAEKYKQKNIKRIPLDVQITKYNEIKAAADSANETVNGFIKTAIDERIKRLNSTR